MHPKPAKLAEDGITAYSLSANNSGKPSYETFPAFSLLGIIFVFLPFVRNPFDSNAPSKASSLSFRRSSV